MTQLYIVTCNGKRMCHPQTLSEAEAYRKLRLDDRKDLRRTGEARDRVDNKTFGAQQEWKVVPA